MERQRHHFLLPEKKLRRVGSDLGCNWMGSRVILDSDGRVWSPTDFRRSIGGDEAEEGVGSEGERVALLFFPTRVK